MERKAEELAREIKDLREEIRQMKEMLGMLFTLVVETDEEEEEGTDILSANGTIAMPRLNN